MCMCHVELSALCLIVCANGFIFFFIIPYLCSPSTEKNDPLIIPNSLCILFACHHFIQEQFEGLYIIAVNKQKHPCIQPHTYIKTHIVQVQCVYLRQCLTERGRSLVYFVLGKEPANCSVKQTLFQN